MLCEWMVQADDHVPDDLFEALVKLHAKYLRYDQYAKQSLRWRGVTHACRLMVERGGSSGAYALPARAAVAST